MDDNEYFDYEQDVMSFSECTGIMPALPESQSDAENYGQIYNGVKKNGKKQSIGKRNNS